MPPSPPEIAPLLPPGREEPDFDALVGVQQRYEVEMDFDSIERLVEEHGLTGVQS